MTMPTPTSYPLMPEGRLAVVSPLANESATVDAWLTRLVAQLQPQDRVYCVIDRVSRDDTLARVERYGREVDPRVRAVWSPENRCVVDAYFAGYRAAVNSDADWVLEMDGGLSHLPEQVPMFRAAMRRGYDFAAGSRFVAGGSHEGSLKRKLVSWGGSKLTNVMLRTTMCDMTSGYQCFTRAALGYVLARGVRSRAHFFQTEIRVMLHGWRWVEVPIRYASPSPSLGASSVGEALRCLWRMRRDGTLGVSFDAMAAGATMTARSAA